VKSVATYEYIHRERRRRKNAQRRRKHGPVSGCRKSCGWIDRFVCTLPLRDAHRTGVDGGRWYFRRVGAVLDYWGHEFALHEARD